jgi:Flp pilus assembly protein TadG
MREPRSESGQALVEFALVLPLLTVLLLGVIQFGILFNNYETLTDAARVGARAAILVRVSGTTPASATQAVYNAAPGLKQSQLGVTVTCPNWTTAGTDVTVNATYPYSINLLGWVVSSGNLTSSTTQPLE